jgi:hypothetical protein
MTLWHLLEGMCFAMPTAAALAVARAAKAGLAGYILAIAIALVMGLVFAWTLHASGKMIWMRTLGRSLSFKEWCARGLYFAAVIWIFVAALAAQWVISIALHVVV